MDADQKPQRKAVSARLRFEVFRRDGFRCVYCGAKIRALDPDERRILLGEFG